MGSEPSKGLEGPQAHRLQLSQTIRKPELMMEWKEVSGGRGANMALKAAPLEVETAG